VLCGARCNGRHTDFMNKIKAQFFTVPATNQGGREFESLRARQSLQQLSVVALAIIYGL
jgi:hypothetical protein